MDYETKSRCLPKVWITKYALTEGVLEANDAHTTLGVAGCLNWGMETFGPRHWWEDRIDAVLKAKTMRDEKVAELQKEIDRLKELVFLC